MFSVPLVSQSFWLTIGEASVNVQSAEIRSLPQTAMSVGVTILANLVDNNMEFLMPDENRGGIDNACMGSSTIVPIAMSADWIGTR